MGGILRLFFMFSLQKNYYLKGKAGVNGKKEG